MWVAITLDHVAEVHLQRGNGDAAAQYFYSTLNHGTPLYSWCEERGQEPGSAEVSGDRQHLWTPIAVVRCLRDMMVMEHGDELNLALGTDRSWLASGKPVGIADAPTHFGPVSYQMQYDAAKSQVSGEAKFADDAAGATAGLPNSAVLHVRLPDGLKVKSVDPASKAEVLADGSGIRWTAPRGRGNSKRRSVGNVVGVTPPVVSIHQSRFLKPFFPRVPKLKNGAVRETVTGA